LRRLRPEARTDQIFIKWLEEWEKSKI